MSPKDPFVRYQPMTESEAEAFYARAREETLFMTTYRGTCMFAEQQVWHTLAYSGPHPEIFDGIEAWIIRNRCQLSWHKHPNQGPYPDIKQT